MADETSAQQVESIEHKRADFKRMRRDSAVEEKIVEAIQWTGLKYGGNSFAEKVKTPLTLCGKTAAHLMKEGDDPILFLPVWVVTAPHSEEVGCVITFSTGILVAWTQGKLRLTYHAWMLPYSQISDVRNDGGEVEFFCERPWKLYLERAFRSEEVIGALINTLEGRGGEIQDGS